MKDNESQKATAGTGTGQRFVVFRAWDTKNSEMHEIFSLEDVFKGGEFVNWDFDDCIIMQYTGLKDRNNTEIYEGDKMGRGIVKFQRGAFVVEGKDYCHDMNYASNNLIVSGNVYEGIASGT